MPLGYPAFRRVHGRKLSTWVIVVCFGLFGLAQWGVFEMRQRAQGELSFYQLERSIGSCVYIDAASSNLPKWLRVVAGTTKSRIRKEIQINCESAERGGFFPEDCYLSWALAVHRMGDQEEAVRLAEKIPGFDATSRLARALIDEGSPRRADIEKAEAAANSGVVDWRTLYLLDQFTDEPAYGIELATAGTMQVRRNLVASAVFWLMMGFGVVSAIWIFVKRKEIWEPRIRDFSLPKTWRVRSVLAAFAGCMVISTGLSISVWWLPVYDYESPGTVIPVVSYLVYVGLPALYLISILTPSLKATGRLFGLTGAAYSKRALWAAAFTLLLAAWVINLPLAWIQIYYRVVDFRDSMNLDVLDGPAGLVSQLIIAAVIAPLSEEVIYRGFLFRTFQNRMRVFPAVLLSSAIFATAHWYSFAGWVSVFFFGMLMCWMAHWSRSLWPGILAHSLLNLILTWMLWANYSYV